MGYKEDFEEIYQSKIMRTGSAELLEWLKTTDFFTAPASTKFHCACLGGLVQHSVSVYHEALQKCIYEIMDSSDFQYVFDTKQSIPDKKVHLKEYGITVMMFLKRV